MDNTKATLKTRAAKAAPLLNSEIDANWTALESAVRVRNESELLAALGDPAIGVILLGAGTFELTATVVIPSNKSIQGAGFSTVIKKAAGATHTVMFDISGGKENISISNLLLDGGGAAIDPTSSTLLAAAAGIETYTGKGTMIGIQVNASNMVILDSLRFKGFNYAGVYVTQVGANGGSGNVQFTGGIKGNNLYFWDNYAGILLNTRAEYSTFNNITANRNVVGISVRGGNVAVSNSQFTKNRIGAHVGTGQNDSHGTFTGCMFNHNSLRGVYVHGITVGHIFGDCQMFDSILEVYDAKGFQWDGGIIGGGIIHQAATSALNRLQNAMFFPGNYNTGSITNNSANLPLSLKNNVWMSGADATGINN